MNLTTQCSKCKGLFLGDAGAWNMMNEPFCAGCFNELAYGKPTNVKPSDIPLFDAPDPKDKGLNIPPITGFPPPTMG